MYAVRFDGSGGSSLFVCLEHGIIARLFLPLLSSKGFSMLQEKVFHLRHRWKCFLAAYQLVRIASWCQRIVLFAEELRHLAIGVPQTKF